MPSASTSASDPAAHVANLARVARVCLDSPLPQLDRLFDYRIPPELEGVAPGVRVRVPLRSAGRTVDAFVVETSEERDYPGPLSDLEALVSPVPVLRPEVWAAARAVATRAAGSASDVLRLAIPTRQVRVEKEWLARERPASRPSPPAPGIDGYPDALGRLLDDRGRAAVVARTGVAPTASGRWVPRSAITLAACAARALASGGSALVAVPDWRHVEHVTAALEGLVAPEDVVRWDARQPNPQRYRGLLRAGDGPAVVIGTRSVVYAPATELALLALWDDGDPLFREPLAPYVHARDAALVRQEQQGSGLVLLGATRSTEAERLVELGFDGMPQFL